jgi:predicted nuclease of predicted toxin-antitoxin system
MAQTKILLDSNSYFRLAQNLHPLLFRSFGAEQFTLYVHNDLMVEFARNPRLTHKFHWVVEKQFTENRSRPLALSKKIRKEIENTHEFIWEHVKEADLGPSRVDVKVLATGAAAEIRIVTDDADMIELAKMYGVHHLTSMELMKLMLDRGHIDADTVERVVQQWRYDHDLPNAGFVRDYIRIFGRKPPKAG